jgi:hypothetical protein
MQTITVLFTKRKWNPISWLIRWALPRSRFALAVSSHCLIVDGDYRIEANILYSVRRSKESVAMSGLTIVRQVDYNVPDAEAGLAWARDKAGEKYDFVGAFGLALRPDRDWLEPGSWFCYELAAGALRAAGKDVFAMQGHVTESMLLMIKP